MVVIKINTKNTENKIFTKRNVLLFTAKYGTIVALILMVIFFSIMAPNIFPTFLNLMNVLNQISLTAIIAAGFTIVAIVGGFDLSIGNVGSYAGILVTGFIASQNLPIALAVILVLAITTLIGLTSGFIIAKAKVNSIITTIGVGTFTVGLNYGYTNGEPIVTGLPEAFANITLYKLFGIIPANIIYMTIVLFALWVMVNHTELGQWIQAVGGNIKAARLSGIPVDRVKIIAFAISAFCAGVTGILLASLIGSGTATAADSYVMKAVSAVFLGSATLKDGEFHIFGTFIGVLIIGLGFNGLAIFGVPTFYQYIFQGSVLVIAVALSSIARMYANK